MTSLCSKDPFKPRLSESSDTSTVSTLSEDSTVSSNSNDEESNAQNQNIRVVTRVRPLSTKELNEQSAAVAVAMGDTNSIQVEKKKVFSYDAVFGPNTSQRQVYEQTAGDILRNSLFKGFNVTVLAYGQTGSGKTHTIFGGNGNMISNQLDEDADGIIPRAVHDVFDHRNRIICGSDRMKVSMSYLEIYNEEAKDLLSIDPSPPELQIRDNGGDVVVQNLSMHVVTSPKEVASLMESASGKRSTAATLMNASSSRSHAICTIYITIAPLPDQVENEDEITAKLTLVDLAGSERAKKTGAVGSRLKEGININKGLFVLGQVVSSLSEKSGGSNNSSIHVKFRDSKLTRLLQDSLGGNSKTVMVACISPADTNTDETINTLRYAERTRNIKNSAVRNVVATPLSPTEAAALRRENQMLKLQLFQAQSKISSTSAVNEPLFTRSSTSKHTIPSNNVAQDGVQEIIDNELNGLSLKELDIVTKLKMHCSSMQERIDQLEDKHKSTVDDCIDASLRADKWKIRYENLLSHMKKNNVPMLAETEKDGDLGESSTLANNLRKEVIDLKEQLRDCAIDAEVSRSIAAAIVNGNGDVDTAETLAMVSADVSEGSDMDGSNMKTEAMSAELVAMSGSIENKEEMIRKILKERELMDSMRSHFESAVQSLQEEVGTLSSERDVLISRLEKDDGSKKCNQTRKLRERTKALESRIKELQRKAAEHRVSLQLQNQSEKKCQALMSELAADKKRRAELQRKLKKESVERRNVQKKAKIDAAKLLRNAQKLKLELNKVKETAAKQESVLRRKAAESMHRQKLLSERSKKRARATGTVMSELSSQRKEEINSYLEREISNALSLQNLRNELEENSHMLQHAEEKREVIISQQRDNEDSAVVRSLGGEIEIRSQIVEQLQKNIAEVYKAVHRNPIVVEKSFSKFLELQFWQNLNKFEVKYVCQIIFSKLVEEKLDCDLLKSSAKSDIGNAVATAVARERRRKEKEVMALKVQHCEDVANLLESTKATVQHDLCNKLHNSIVPNDPKIVIEHMLKDYLLTYDSVGNKTLAELKDIKSSQDGMKRLVDGMADEILSQNEAKALLAARKKKKAKKAGEADVEIEDIFRSDDEKEGFPDDGDDSDWSPDTPVPTRKKQRTSLERIEDPKSPQAISVNISTPELDEKNYGKMTVVQLKVLLRQNGLTVSGKKVELIQRLLFYGSTKARDVVTASARKRTRSVPRIEVPDPIVSKRLRIKSPVPPATRKISPTACIPSGLSSSRKGSRVLTSSTKASQLRRRTPTENETTQLVTKRGVRKSPRAASSIDNSVESKTASRDRNRRQANSKHVSEQRTLQARKVARAAKRSDSSQDSSVVSEATNVKAERNSTESVSSSKSEEGTRSTSRRAKIRPASAKRVIQKRNFKSQRPSRPNTLETGKAKSGSPSRPLSSITNSAKKRRTNRRQNMARSVNMALAELEKLNESL